jgi:hypothetical protein
MLLRRKRESQERFKADKTAWNVATDIYNNHPLGVDKVEVITCVKSE